MAQQCAIFHNFEVKLIPKWPSPLKFHAKRNGPQAVSQKTLRNILEKFRLLQMRIYARVPAPRQGGEAKTVSCKLAHSFVV